MFVEELEALKAKVAALKPDQEPEKKGVLGFVAKAASAAVNAVSSDFHVHFGELPKDRRKELMAAHGDVSGQLLCCFDLMVIKKGLPRNAPELHMLMEFLSSILKHTLSGGPEHGYRLLQELRALDDADPRGMNLLQEAEIGVDRMFGSGGTKSALQDVRSLLESDLILEKCRIAPPEPGPLP